MIRGWCPSLHEPMATGDGVLVRVKPPLGRISAREARVLADAALEHGDGGIELTSRGALQFRGLTTTSAGRFAAVVVELGLAVADAAAERRRSVLVSPLAGIDPDVAPATAGLALALEAAIVREEALAGLPAKFRFAVDGGGTLPLGGGANVTLCVGADGCVLEGRAVRTEDAVAVAVGLARSVQHSAPSPRPSPGGRGGTKGIGWLAGGRAFGAGVRFGELDARTLAGLADLAGEGDGVIRLTPWRAVVLAGLSDPEKLAALGLIVSADEPALRVSACVGQPGCASASVATRDLARRLRPGPGTTIHVSGCSKGCAHPGPAALTFVGRDGGFDLVRAGRAGDIPAQCGLAPAEVSEIA